MSGSPLYSCSRTGLTLHISHVCFLVKTIDLVISEVVHEVNHLLHAALGATLIGILAFGRRIGALKN